MPYTWFLFVKQKTAYDMRISDWSSDVCSSDLGREQRGAREGAAAAPIEREHQRLDLGHGGRRHRQFSDAEPAQHRHRLGFGGKAAAHARPASMDRTAAHRLVDQPPHRRMEPVEPRSEEHTSKLQSLMRIAYAVFCLKKKKQTTTHINQH